MDFIRIVIGGAILSGIIGIAVKAPGNALAQKFAKAGTLAGKTKSEIAALVGRPR